MMNYSLFYVTGNLFSLPPTPDKYAREMLVKDTLMQIWKFPYLFEFIKK